MEEINISKEKIEQAIINVERMTDPDKEKVRLLKKGLKEFVDVAKKQIYPFGVPLDSKDTEVSTPGLLLSMDVVIATIVYFLHTIDLKFSQHSSSEIIQQQQDFSKTLIAFSLPFIIMALYDIGLLSKKIIDAIIEYNKEKKNHSESIKILKEAGIYDVVVENQEKKLSEGRVK